MTDIDHLLRFVASIDAFATEDPPWVERAEPRIDVRLPIDWQVLFPGRKPQGRDELGFPIDDSWNPDPDQIMLDELMEELGDATDKGALDVGLTRDGGWDVAAWYQPIHFFGPDWGIYIKEAAIRQTAVNIARFHPRNFPGCHAPRLLRALIRSAAYVYFLHEQFHHKIESLGFRLEVIAQRPIYVPYTHGVYRRLVGSDDLLEEALANADCVRRLEEPRYAAWIPASVQEATRRYLLARFPLDPPGYRVASRFTTSSAFDSGRQKLQSQVLEGSVTGKHNAADWQCAPQMTRSFFSVESDMWTVVPPGATSILPTRASLPVRTTSTARLIQLLVSKGYQVVNGGKGSHVKLKNGGNMTVILPGGRDNLSPGVVRAALRALGGYSLQDLDRLLAGANL
jgi:predicted RNA binding protein YcfA (HicA-like mRNA interferase family)